MLNTLENIRKELKSLGDEEYATRLQKYFKTGKGGYGECDKFMGIQASMPRTMLRYAIEKFPEEKRKSYLKGNYKTT